MSKFLDNGYNKLVWRGSKYCLVASFQPMYIYTTGGYWNFFEGERWKLIYFWPSLDQVNVRENPCRILLLKREK